MLGYDPKDVLPPKHGKTPYELLSDDTVDPPSLVSAYGWQASCAGLGAMIQVVKNWHGRRPIIAGSHMYLIYGVIGGVVGQAILQWRLNFWAERDAVLRHYVKLHPEDFPPPERKKYGDVFLEWVPIR